MNFLEELAAEWYGYNGYFCRTNVRFGKMGHGGRVGEMDVVAYHPGTREFIHIECSADTLSWEERRKVFQKKFKNASRYYDSEFPFQKSKVRRVAIAGYFHPKVHEEEKLNFGDGTEVILIPDFVASLLQKLSKLNPFTAGPNETYPLLRAMQYAAFYGRRRIVKQRLKI